MRTAEIARKTNETDIKLSLSLDLMGADLQAAVDDPASNAWAELSILSRAEVGQATGRRGAAEEHHGGAEVVAAGPALPAAPARHARLNQKMYGGALADQCLQLRLLHPEPVPLVAVARVHQQKCQCGKAGFHGSSFRVDRSQRPRP